MGMEIRSILRVCLTAGMIAGAAGTAWAQPVIPEFAPVSDGVVLGPWRFDGQVEAADVNGDGLLDAVVSDLHGDGQYPPHVRDFSVLLNTGDGTFAPPVVSAVAGVSTPRANFSEALLALGDLNEDGYADLVTRGGPEPTGIPGNRPNLAVLFGTPEGTFINQVDIPNSTTDQFMMLMLHKGLALGDVNEDGHLDLVSPANHGLLAVRLGDGAGGFGPSIASGSSGPASVMLLGDVNGDGHLDAVSAFGTGSSSTGASRIDVSVGDGTGLFTLSHATGIDGTIFGSRGVQMGDFDGDGLADLALRGRAGGERGRGGVYVLHGTPQGRLESIFRETGVQAGEVVDVAAGDFNGDGRDELIKIRPPGEQGEVLMFDGSGGVTREPFPDTAPAYVWGLDVADVVGSSLPDILVWDHRGFSESITSVRWIENTTFVEPPPPPCAADWNTDGTLDSNDLFAFLDSYFSGIADFNADAATNSDDFFAFLTAFFEGCA